MNSWFLVLSKGPGDEALRSQYLEAHQEWLNAQHRSGRILFSGPSGDRVYGIYVVTAGTEAEATDLARSDPFHAHHVREMTVVQWDVRRFGRLDGTLENAVGGEDPDWLSKR